MNILIFSITCFLSVTLYSQNLNVEHINSLGQKMLLGEIDKSGLNKEHYKTWFSKNYGDFEPDEAIIESLRGKLNDYSITIFMGTWCGDSKLQVPRFYKIIEALQFPKHQLKVIAVNNDYEMYKQSPQHEEKGLNIHRVPTFIFYKNGQEINRIVEHPVESLEEDILSIVNDNNYKPNFEIVRTVNTILKESGVGGLKRKQKLIIEHLGDKTKSYSELNTYGSILRTTNKLAEAIAVYKLNLKLFPETPRAYQSLAIAYSAQNKAEKAETILKKALRKFPQHKALEKSLEQLKTK